MPFANTESSFEYCDPAARVTDFATRVFKKPHVSKTLYGITLFTSHHSNTQNERKEGLWRRLMTGYESNSLNRVGLAPAARCYAVLVRH
jgi:hypothetical protein